MGKKVLLVGHCAADVSYLRIAIRGAEPAAEIFTADDQEELDCALEGAGGVDLLLINRQLGYGFDPAYGVEIIARLKEKRPLLRMMLISNYAEAQRAAIEVGALAGFSKREIGSKRVTALLKHALGDDDAAGN